MIISEKQDQEKRAQESLRKLVEYVFTHPNASISGISYQGLAGEIKWLDKNRNPNARGMGKVLGKMGHLLEGLKWDRPIPKIQSLVVKKSGSLKGLPGEGINEFWGEWPQLSPTEKKKRVQDEYKKIIEFGDQWNNVLEALDLEKVVRDEANPNQTRKYGSGGESPQHKRLKEYIKTHPEIVGAEKKWEARIEFPLPSQDQIDVFFYYDKKCIAVEVKSAVSEGNPDDYRRGLYQTIKYEAILKAMIKASDNNILLGIQSVRSVLVLEAKLQTQERELAQKLDVEVIENIKLDY
ncbi:MAG: hypothetical protein ACYCYP_08135 [Leptospirales bacterium]